MIRGFQNHQSKRAQSFIPAAFTAFQFYPKQNVYINSFKISFGVCQCNFQSDLSWIIHGTSKTLSNIPGPMFSPATFNSDFMSSCVLQLTPRATQLATRMLGILFAYSGITRLWQDRFIMQVYLRVHFVPVLYIVFDVSYCTTSCLNGSLSVYLW